MNKLKTGYHLATGLVSAMLLMGAGVYILNYDMVAEMFVSLGYPTYVIYPLAIAKILAVIALWYKKYPMLTEWAYAGLFFVFLLAISAHVNAGDGQFAGALVALLLLITSYKLNLKLGKK
ncbi:DoxX family protein [Candidatus Uhrbacteria bacterium]|jgi:hypothetical protein|nr:DoxX family protein [Candidatus Uhrbacteria bacterium]